MTSGNQETLVEAGTRVGLEAMEVLWPYVQPLAEDERVNETWTHLRRACTRWNDSMRQIEPYQIIVATICTIYVLTRLWKFLNGEESLWQRTKNYCFRMVRRLPVIGGIIKKEIAKNIASMQDELDAVAKMPYYTKLPETGLGRKGVEEMVRQYQSMCEVDWKSGHVSGAVYGAANEELSEVAGEVYCQHMWTNPLHPDLFPNIRKMEAEVVRMTLSLYHGDDESCGTMSTGGTESIMLMIYAYRNYAKAELGIDKPEIIAPRTIHAAFDKACHCFGVKMVHVDEDPVTRRANVKAMRRRINRNTILLVGSAPQFAHGTIDPIKELSELGLRYRIGVHVDACLGSFFLPFMEAAGVPVEPFDFRLRGVTSISADTHKYGYAPKGSSVIMYRDKSLRHYQYFVNVDWPGGMYATPTFGGSRAGAVIASCWASLMYMGYDGYLESTKRILECKIKIVEGLKPIHGIHIEGVPEVSIIAIGSNHFNIFRLSSAMVEKGWSLNPLQFPASIHICLTLMHTQPGVVDKFLEDIKSCTAVIMLDPKKKVGGVGAIYGTACSIPDRSMVSEIVTAFMDATYSTKSKNHEKEPDAPLMNGSAVHEK